MGWEAELLSTSRANLKCMVMNEASSFHSGKILHGQNSRVTHDGQMSSLVCGEASVCWSNVLASVQLTKYDEFTHLSEL